MTRFLARLAPMVLMAYPIYVYRGHFEGLDASLDWRQHTFEARSLAERVARDAGAAPDPDRLRLDVAEFARAIADNPTQVTRAAAMRRALDRDPPDPARVAELALEAIEEENRLLPDRVRDAREKLAETRRLADWVFVIGCAVIVLQALVDFLLRATDPGHRRHHASSPTPKPPLRWPGGGR